ncbi:hypothetical protein ACFL3V_03375 [Nanoarchaeota archaeon]
MNRSLLIWLFLAIMALCLFVGIELTGKSAAITRDEMIDCSLGTEIGFITINDIVQACYTDNAIYFAVDNVGTTRLSGLNVKLDADYDLDMIIKESIEPGHSSSHNLNFGNQGMRGMDVLTLYPLTGKDRVACSHARVQIFLERC